ncbi:hypothetical protein GCM10022245_67390 [Streptomyces mayteni]
MARTWASALVGPGPPPRPRTPGGPGTRLRRGRAPALVGRAARRLPRLAGAWRPLALGPRPAPGLAGSGP